MKKILSVIFLILVLAIILTACGNQQFIDTTYTFNKAMIKMPDDTIIFGDIASWKDYDDCDQVQVRMKDGKTYYTSSENIVLIAE